MPFLTQTLSLWYVLPRPVRSCMMLMSTGLCSKLAHVDDDVMNLCINWILGEGVFGCKGEFRRPIDAAFWFSDGFSDMMLGDSPTRHAFYFWDSLLHFSFIQTYSVSSFFLSLAAFCIAVRRKAGLGFCAWELLSASESW